MWLTIITSIHGYGSLGTSISGSALVMGVLGVLLSDADGASVDQRRGREVGCNDTQLNVKIQKCSNVLRHTAS